MSLSAFIRDRREESVVEFATFARTLMPAGADMSEAELRDHAEDILTAAVEDMGTAQTAEEQSRQSRTSACRAWMTLRDSFVSLTPRERQVMVLVVSGMLNNRLGGELGISEITVKAHRAPVMRKMKADSFADLVTMAARLGLPQAQKH